MSPVYPVIVTLSRLSPARTRAQVQMRPSPPRHPIRPSHRTRHQRRLPALLMPLQLPLQTTPTQLHPPPTRPARTRRAGWLLQLARTTPTLPLRTKTHRRKPRLPTTPTPLSHLPLLPRTRQPPTTRPLLRHPPHLTPPKKSQTTTPTPLSHLRTTTPT